MNFEIREMIADMLSAIRDLVHESWPEVRFTMTRFLEKRRERLDLLAQLRVSGELDEENFAFRLKNEKLVLEAELRALGVVSKSVAQKASNAALEAFENAVKAAYVAAL